MKTCLKLPEPATLAAYRVAQGGTTWEQMRNDAHYGGQQAYEDIKETLVQGQRCLCAYCEMRVAAGTSRAEIRAGRNGQRVEHFHPKEDRTGPPNWALHWPNLWAVCPGGSQRPPEGEAVDPRNYLEPLPNNLSCDAYKDYQIRRGQLNPHPEGWILAPNEVPPFPRLIQYAPNGTPEPWPEGCRAFRLAGNRHRNTLTLVSETVRHLNLGCARLNRSRQIALGQLEKTIEKSRKAQPRASPPQVLQGLARRLFPKDARRPWAEFFTLIRWRLGDAAEQHLQAIHYQG